MKDMFEDSANFTGITKQPVKIGKAVQKAFIEINEEGSEAAAVTGKSDTFFLLHENNMPTSHLLLYLFITTPFSNIHKVIISYLHVTHNTFGEFGFCSNLFAWFISLYN